MARRDIGTDDPRVKVRPGKSSRPRTKVRPSHDKATPAWVYAVDRGRYHTVLTDGSGTRVSAVKSRELGRRGVVVGDTVGLEGDISGRKDTLARIVKIAERRQVLRRSLEDGEAAGLEKVIVAGADQLLIVTAASNPPPRPGMIDRCLVAAADAGIEPIICLTKTDLDGADEVASGYERLGVRLLRTALPEDGQPLSPAQIASLQALRQALCGHYTVFVGHSGVGKTTLINALVPGAGRLTGQVNEVTGRGRHTSTSAHAFPLPPATDPTAPLPPANPPAGGDAQMRSGAGGAAAEAIFADLAQVPGWVIDTPGVRSFGLGHVTDEGLLAGFWELEMVARHCPRGCCHLEEAPNCALDRKENALEWDGSGPLGADPWAQGLLWRLPSYRRLRASRTSGS